MVKKRKKDFDHSSRYQGDNLPSITAECDLPADTEVMLYLKTQKRASHDRAHSLAKNKVKTKPADQFIALQTLAQKPMFYRLADSTRAEHDRQPGQ